MPRTMVHLHAYISLLHLLIENTGYAIPAINVTSSSTVVASLEAARDSKSPIVRVHTVEVEEAVSNKIPDSSDEPGRSSSTKPDVRTAYETHTDFVYHSISPEKESTTRTNSRQSKALSLVLLILEVT
jgi:hypothetical protein